MFSDSCEDGLCALLFCTRLISSVSSWRFPRPATPDPTSEATCAAARALCGTGHPPCSSWRRRRPTGSVALRLRRLRPNQCREPPRRRSRTSDSHSSMRLPGMQPQPHRRHCQNRMTFDFYPKVWDLVCVDHRSVVFRLVLSRVFLLPNDCISLHQSNAFSCAYLHFMIHKDATNGDCGCFAQRVEQAA
jgi:hypothetical protein